VLVDGTHGTIVLVDGTDKYRWFLLIVQMCARRSFRWCFLVV
jgi:hypothetical protein